MEEHKLFLAVNMMMRIHKMHIQMIDSNVSKIGMHSTHHRILMHIARNNKLDSQKSLAEHIGVTPAAITGALKKLEKDGYIKRIQGIDNRYNEVEITENGKVIVEKTRKLFSEIDKQLFSGFSEKELDEYMFYMGKIQANIKSAENEGMEDIK